RLRPGVEGVQAVVLVPSRELALQIETVFRRMNTPFKAISCYGGRPAMDEHRTMRGVRPSVIIGTPGRMNDHLRKQNFEATGVTTLVIDEFDKSLELGFQEEMAEVIGQLPGLRKRILLSATDAEEIPQFVGMGEGSSRGAFIKLNFLTEEPLSERLSLRKVLSPAKDKLETLYQLLCTLGDASTLVFVNYRESVERIASFLKSKKFPCVSFHGGMEQQDRERALYKFRNGCSPVLISTDLAARGLDIPGVENVVHYHLPINEEAFTHRNGRTARWEASGCSFLLLHAEEQLPEYMSGEILDFSLPDDTSKPPKPRWSTLYIGKGKKDKVNKIDIVGFIYKKGGLQKEDVGQVDVKEHYAFVAVRRSKVKQLLTLLRGEKIKGMKTIIEEAK
ncbi:MAG: DEAD/DEAH box helicase, partial [Muribaculaceae bacterium]|nr:DEAD/DEAH box helicase [Muribaculaceae bacterium]